MGEGGRNEQRRGSKEWGGRVRKGEGCMVRLHCTENIQEMKEKMDKPREKERKRELKQRKTVE